MTDRELLESLGLTVIVPTKAWGDTPFVLDSDPDEDLTVGQYISQPAFFLEVDDALAKRGWKTELRRDGDTFAYLAQGVRTFYEADEAATRLEAVRPVYERIMEGEQRP